MPINARVVVFSVVMSELLKNIVPESVVYVGFPAIAFASVDLPEPLCPANNTRSPARMFTLISCNNLCFDSDKDTFKFFISNIFNPLTMPFG